MTRMCHPEGWPPVGNERVPEEVSRGEFGELARHELAAEESAEGVRTIRKLMEDLKNGFGGQHGQRRWWARRKVVDRRQEARGVESH